MASLVLMPMTPNLGLTSNLTADFFFLLFFFFLIFWPQHMALRILVPRLGIEPVCLAVEVGSLKYWSAREVL